MKLSPHAPSNSSVHLWLLYILSIAALIVGIFSIVRTMHSKERFGYTPVAFFSTKNSSETEEEGGILLQKNGNSLEIQANLIAKDITLTQSTGKLVNTVIFSKQFGTLSFYPQDGLDLNDDPSMAQLYPNKDLILFKSLIYEPLLTNSFILLTVYLTYHLGDSYGSDEVQSYVKFNNFEGQRQIQLWNGQYSNIAGGGTRSGTIFPLTGMYGNTTGKSITINIGVNNMSNDDKIRFMIGDPYQYFAVLQEISK